MMPPTDPSSRQKQSSDYVFQGGELHLSNFGQLELLSAMMERGVSLRTMVRGFSMHPFIQDQDVLTITPVSGLRLSCGDVVAFTQPDSGRLAIHRIIGRTDKGWIIRGDNCPEADGVVKPVNILGRVTCVERNGRIVHAGLGNSGVMIAVLNRGSGLMHMKQFLKTVRRIAGHVLKSLQTLPTYRLLGRWFAPKTVIEPADENDMEIFHNLLNPNDPYRKQPQNPNVTNWVARQAGKVIGFAQLVHHPEENFPWTGHWLFSLHVRGLYRGLGIGEKLVRQVLGKARDQYVGELFLVVFEDNKRAINLYSKLGFMHITLPGLEPLLSSEKQQTGRRRIVMQKKLR
jgi:ribosomal protein S18 acetylase RimI-like enzyme